MDPKIDTHKNAITFYELATENKKKKENAVEKKNRRNTEELGIDRG